MFIHLAYLIYKKQHIYMNTMQQKNPTKYYLPVSAPSPPQETTKKEI